MTIRNINIYISKQENINSFVQLIFISQEIASGLLMSVLEGNLSNRKDK
jgi:hypothetical protein